MTEKPIDPINAPTPDEQSGTTRTRRRRRKDARPSEIIDAALTVFGERGYGAARVEDVARLAGVSKGTLFVYFPNKEELFRAVAKSVLATQLDVLTHVTNAPDLPLQALVPLLLTQAARAGQGGLPRMARLIISESRAFPDLARVWHDEVVSKVLGLLTGAIERGQDRGEISEGDPQLHAFSILAPIFMGALFREVFKDNHAALPDLPELARQHAQTVLRGMVKQ